MNKEEQFNILYEVLNNISPISKKIFNKSKQYFSTKSLKSGEYLFKVEDNVKDFYFLSSGIARYYYLTDDGKEYNKSFAQNKGHLLSSISSVIGKYPSPFSVEILSDFTCLYISYDDFISLGEQYCSWNKLTLKIYENLIIKKEQREADFLLLNARQRYEKFMQEYPRIIGLVRNYHIASYLGITEVALSRIRKEMNLT